MNFLKFNNYFLTVIIGLVLLIGVAVKVSYADEKAPEEIVQNLLETQLITSAVALKMMQSLNINQKTLAETIETIIFFPETDRATIYSYIERKEIYDYLEEHEPEVIAKISALRLQKDSDCRYKEEIQALFRMQNALMDFVIYYEELTKTQKIDVLVLLGHFYRLSKEASSDKQFEESVKSFDTEKKDIKSYLEKVNLFINNSAPSMQFCSNMHHSARSRVLMLRNKFNH